MKFTAEKHTASFASHRSTSETSTIVSYSCIAEKTVQLIEVAQKWTNLEFLLWYEWIVGIRKNKDFLVLDDLESSREITCAKE
jgi:hypothetical protein